MKINDLKQIKYKDDAELNKAAKNLFSVIERRRGLAPSGVECDSCSILLLLFKERLGAEWCRVVYRVSIRSASTK